MTATQSGKGIDFDLNGFAVCFPQYFAVARAKNTAPGRIVGCSVFVFLCVVV